MSRVPLPYWRRSRLVWLGVALLLGLSAATYAILAAQERAARTQLLASLQQLTTSRAEILRRWAAEQTLAATNWAASPDIVRLTHRLLAQPRTPAALLRAPELQELRRLLTPPIASRGYRGMYLISRDSINIAAMRDVNLGGQNLLAGRGPWLEEALTGLSVLTHPVPSDVHLADASGVLRPGLPTMFALAPVRDSIGAVIALLAFRLDPAREFDWLSHLGGLGASGESLVFDERGLLLSPSRFEPQLRALGLLSADRSSALALRLADPLGPLPPGRAAGNDSMQHKPLTGAVAAAIATKGPGSDLDGLRDYRGVPVVGAWQWDTTLRIGLVTKLDRTEALRPVQQARRAVLAALGIAAMMLGVLSVQTGREYRRAVTYAEHEHTAAKQAEELASALNQSEERYRLLADNSRDVISLQDDQGLLLYNSPSAEAILGHSLVKLATLSTSDLVHPDDRDALLRARDEAFTGSGASNSIHRVRHADGHWVWFESLYRRTGGTDDQPMRLLVTSRDVTQRKELEQQFLQSQKLEGIGRLAGGVAHDFNNLLTGILGNVDLIVDRLGPDHPAAEYVQDIAFAGQRGSALTGQLLTFSRQQVVQPRLLDLNEVLRNMERLLQRLIGEDVELVTRATPSLPLVFVDEGQVGQVILNLGVNARDAMARGGRLTIATDVVELDEEYTRHHPDVKPGAYVLLAVSDTGVGISPEVAAHIFEPFFTTKGVGKGTGLGLATCFGIVRSAGGHIGFYSEVNVGTTFKVYLPLAAGTLPVVGADKKATLAVASAGTETVLVVEDDATVRSLTIRLLRNLGYTVMEARDGEEALRLFADGHATIDVVISDMVMPRMGGRELAKRLREIVPEVRMLLVSGYTAEVVDDDRGAPQEFFLQKPFTRLDLARAVREALTG